MRLLADRQDRYATPAFGVDLRANMLTEPDARKHNDHTGDLRRA
jgi:hypothetical protein